MSSWRSSPRISARWSGTVLELARNYNIRVEDFFAATLRAYLDMNNNYFPELEKQSSELRKKIASREIPITAKGLEKYLREDHGYSIEHVDFSKTDPALKDLFFHFSEKKLLLNQGLSPKETLFILARECAYSHLEIEERPLSNLENQVDSFELLRNGFRGSYFASALLIPQEELIEKTREFIAKPKWDQSFVEDWAHGSIAPVSAIFHRLSQILPGHFGIEQIFFLRFNYEPSTGQPQLLKELHLSELHAPHEVKNQGHYCRRWVTTKLMEGLASSKDTLRAGVQRSTYSGTDKEYLCFSVAYRKELDPKQVECVTIGVRVDDRLKDRVSFLADPAVPRKTVSDACESCAVEDCAERAAPPTTLIRIHSEARVERALEKLR